MTTPERHADTARNKILNSALSDLDQIINGYDPETDTSINNIIWDRLDRLAVEIEAKARDAALVEAAGVCDGSSWLSIGLREEILALRTKPREPAQVTAQCSFVELATSAIAEAEKAMRKFPQPNYVLLKVAEEAGEVVKAAVHFAEGRETRQAVEDEMRQTIAMLYRLWVEGDEVNGVPSIAGGNDE